MLLRMRSWTVLVKVLDTVDTNLGIGIEMKYLVSPTSIRNPLTKTTYAAVL